MWRSCFLICCFVGFLQGIKLSGQELELSLVQVITRHGARTPFTLLPNDKTEWNCSLTGLSIPDHTEQSSEKVNRLYRQRYIRNRQFLPGNCSMGELTYEGYKQHFALGAQFRDMYINKLNFLSSTYDSSQIYIRSTDVPRTIASASAQMLGLYPPETRPETSIIDIFTVEAATEDMAPGGHCPTLTQMCYAVQNTTAWIQKLHSMIPLQQQLAAIWNTTNIPWWIGLYDAFYARAFHNLPLPPGITQSIVDHITTFVEWQLVTLYADTTMDKLGMGTFLGEVLQNMQNNINGEKDPRWFLFSAHDTSLAMILSGYKVFAGLGWPPYAAHLVLELWRDPSNSEYYVKMLYNDQQLKIPGCPAELCPFSDFSAVTQKLIPVNWAQECGLTQRSRTYYAVGAESNDVTAFFC